MSDKEKNSQALVFPGIPPVLGELLRALPDTLELQHPAAEERLYPGPGDADEGQLAEDWKAYVEPDLQQAFSESRQTVTSDLQAMKESADGLLLRIPVRHWDAWVSVLTQARLAIAAVHKLGEEELSQPELPEITNAREAALHRLHLYGLLAESIIQAMEGRLDLEEYEDLESLDDIEED